MPTAITRGAMSAKGFGYTSTTPSDPFFSSVTLLMEAAAGGVVDLSKNAYGVTANNGASVSVVQSKFGGSSYDFRHALANDGYFTFTGSGAPILLGAGDFTLEGWVYATDLATGGMDLLGSSVAATATDFELYLNTAGTLVLVNGSGTHVYVSTSTFAINGWNHWALVRSSGTLMSFFNGTKDATTTANSTTWTAASSAYVGKGNAAIGEGTCPGFQDQVRVTPGVARYTSTFTAPSTPFPTH